ncbi:hypothetical protein M432DRAFT_202758 [Thermoascus aurantiacus ATCC 26904]
MIVIICSILLHLLELKAVRRPREQVDDHSPENWPKLFGVFAHTGSSIPIHKLGASASADLARPTKARIAVSYCVRSKG